MREACVAFPDMRGVSDPSPLRGRDQQAAERECDQLLIGASEPMPFGVFIAAQVPLATYFQALPW